MFGTREIRDQVFNEKENIVMITVVCCNPKKILEKICCKGRKTITSIEIKEPPKQPQPKEVETPKETEKAKKTDNLKEGETPKTPDHSPVQAQVIVQYGYPGMPCCGPCSEGYTGGPCYHVYGGPAPPRPVCHGYGYEYGYVYGYGGSRPCNVSRCGNYFYEDNSSGCTIM